MKTRTAQKIVAILLMSSLVLIVFSSIWKLISPSSEQAAKSEQQLKVQESINSRDLLLQEQSGTEAATNSAGYKQWASESVLPEVYQPDLQSFVGRARDEKALEGVKVFLVLPPDGSLPLPTPSLKASSTQNSSSMNSAPMIGLPLKNAAPWYWNIEKTLNSYEVKRQNTAADSGSSDSTDKNSTENSVDSSAGADTASNNIPDGAVNVKGPEDNAEANADRSKIAEDNAHGNNGGNTDNNSGNADTGNNSANKQADSNSTTPTTQKLVERLIDEKTGETSLDPTATKAGDVTVSEISVSANVARETKERLEALGAKVVVIGGTSKAMTEQQRAAAVGSAVLADFTERLRQAGISSERINQIKEKLVKAESYNIDPEELASLFPEVGVSQDLRLLLDIERQYKNYLCIEFSVLDGNVEERASRIVWAGNSSDNGAQTVVESEPNQQPVYPSYVEQERQRLATKAGNNLGGLLPDMKSDNMVQQKLGNFTRYTNLNSIDVVLGRLTNPIDGKILASTENCAVIAEALANSVFEFYNQEK